MLSWECSDEDELVIYHRVYQQFNTGKNTDLNGEPFYEKTLCDTQHKYSLESADEVYSSEYNSLKELFEAALEGELD